MKASTDYRFGPFRLDLRTGILWRGEEPVALAPKASELLACSCEKGSTA